MSALVWVKGSALPTLTVWWTNSFGTLYDLSAATSFTCKIGMPGSAPLLDKDTSITGAAGTGTGEDEADTPNVTITWATGDLNITPGTWVMELSCLDGGLPRKLTVPFVIQPTFS